MRFVLRRRQRGCASFRGPATLTTARRPGMRPSWRGLRSTGDWLRPGYVARRETLYVHRSPPRQSVGASVVHEWAGWDTLVAAGAAADVSWGQLQDLCWARAREVNPLMPELNSGFWKNYGGFTSSSCDVPASGSAKKRSREPIVPIEEVATGEAHKSLCNRH